MSSNITNQVAYLRASRDFPKDMSTLSIELSKSYIDIANAVNTRTIGIYSVTKSAITGNSWYIQNNQKQQSLRQIYPFTTIGNIPHNLDLSQVDFVSPNSYGSFSDGTNFYGVIFGSNVAIAGQISFYITPTDIVILSGGGSPTISSGIIVLEYLSNT